MLSRDSLLGWCVLLFGVVSFATGCSDQTRCTAEIMDGKYRGIASGKKGQRDLDEDAKRDACLQRCAAEKADILDDCAKRCLAEIRHDMINASVRCDG
ncbi:hypothetical protein [Chondromyces crocatus]|uniref:Lipoprotein n=1 Tax=Chondromyces crocatus TaxID=52 RepID=A0A0K1E6N6_CHOCO|nr:hypothetical protein [Chondromyces crocatus]AKT36223.1 uncharacterized protein CMC5_003370 [Chondromyces crocatus]